MTRYVYYLLHHSRSEHPFLLIRNPDYFSTVVSFYHIRAQERTKYASVLHCTNSALNGFLLKEDEAKTKCSGIINLLFGILVDNTRGHFAHCSHFSLQLRGSNTTQLVKFPRVLSTKTPSKVCVLG